MNNLALTKNKEVVNIVPRVAYLRPDGPQGIRLSVAIQSKTDEVLFKQISESFKAHEISSRDLSLTIAQAGLALVD